MCCTRQTSVSTQPLYLELVCGFYFYPWLDGFSEWRGNVLWAIFRFSGIFFMARAP